MEATKEFCSNFFYGIYLVFYYTYTTIKFVLSTIFEGIGYVWYPIKERCRDCCVCCNKRMNPY